ncbi:S49 family peptidase (plasmid) [Entomospira nematocerorum]|uniref:S49 family peptidase n=1 Tax=Entomospira nematocerorum TaxID=2719987 RepID=A0A968GDE2_9SPIO|nr:S49 family peptidase [Entomospira nematocera]NIZ47797.1 S49 family peptidase [Entomospira nematocera]WDI34775.1 S49 family peptidase [Entomospira nematocera]
MHKYWLVSSEFSEQLLPLIEKYPELLASAMANLPQDIPSQLSSRVDGHQAIFRIDGILTNTITAEDLLLAKHWGIPLPTTYQQIANTIATYSTDENIETIVMQIDSVGGVVAGIDVAIDAIRLCTKPIKSEVIHFCASAAYWLASQCDEIVAVSRLSQIGSIGAMVAWTDNSTALENAGYAPRIVRSSHAPKKNRSPKEEGGMDDLQQMVDTVEAMFLADIAEGRKTTKEKVIDTFGSGGMLFAHDALSVGMIDGVIALAQSNEQRGQGSPKENTDMSVSEEEHKKAVAMAIEGERNRISQLQTIAQLFPCEASEKLVAEAIASGKSYQDVAPEAIEISHAMMTKLQDSASSGVENPPLIHPETLDSIETPQASLTPEAKQLQEEHELILQALQRGGSQ